MQGSGRVTPFPDLEDHRAGLVQDRRAMVDLLEGMATTRAIRRYTDEPVTDEQLQRVLFAATRAPSGSNRQPLRFVALRDSAVARRAKQLIAGSAQAFWADKRRSDGYDRGSGSDADSPKARMARTMEAFVDDFANVPAVILPCFVRYRPAWSGEGASIYPACQNLLLGARAVGLGGVLTHWHEPVAAELHELLAIPEEVVLAATIALGQPAGSHGPVRRRPLSEVVYEDAWKASPPWAEDPPGTRFTSAGPPR